MAEALSFSDVAELFLSELSGTRFSNRAARRTRTSTRVGTTPGESDPVGVAVHAAVALAALDEGDDDGSDGEPLYEGSIGYYVRLEREYDDEELAPALVALVWPYLRAGLLEQASRLGTTRLKLPLALNEDQLTPKEPEAIGDAGTESSTT